MEEQEPDDGRRFSVGPTPRKALNEERDHTRQISYAGSEVFVQREEDDCRGEEPSQPFAIDQSTSHAMPAAVASRGVDRNWRESQLKTLSQYVPVLGAAAFRNISERRDEEPMEAGGCPDRTPRKPQGCDHDYTHEQSYVGSEMFAASV